MNISELHNYLPLSERIAKLHINPDYDKEVFDPKKTTGNVSIRSDLSKAGLANIFMGQKQSGLNKNPMLDTNEIKKSNLTENTMRNIIPIKEMIIEEGLTDAIQRNASKISGGLLLGAGAAAAHAANGGDFHLGNSGGETTANEHQTTNKNEDTTTIKLPNGTDRHVDYSKEQGTGLKDHLGNWVDDRSNVNYHKNVMDAVNSDSSFLTGGEKLGLGGAALAGGLGLGLSSAAKRGYRVTKKR